MGTRTFNGTIEKMNNLDQSVIELHNIARQVENEIGTGKLSITIRKCADQLTELLNPIKISVSTAKGDQ